MGWFLTPILSIRDVMITYSAFTGMTYETSNELSCTSVGKFLHFALMDAGYPVVVCFPATGIVIFERGRLLLLYFRSVSDQLFNNWELGGFTSVSDTINLQVP